MDARQPAAQNHHFFRLRQVPNPNSATPRKLGRPTNAANVLTSVADWDPVDP